MPRVVRLVPVALVLAAASVRAQTAADSLPARAGTWALEAGVSTGTPTLGALRFTGPRTAVGFNVFGNYTSRSIESTAQFSGITYSATTLGASLGLRRYAPVRGALAGFGTLGAQGLYTRYRSDGSRQHDAGAGGFGEFGAAYVIAGRLAVNAFTRAAVTRRFGRSINQTGGGATVAQRARGWDASAGNVGLSATLFF